MSSAALEAIPDAARPHWQPTKRAHGHKAARSKKKKLAPRWDAFDVDTFVPIAIVGRRTVRDQPQAKVQWEPGYTTLDERSAKIDRVLQRHGDGVVYARFADSWEKHTPELQQQVTANQVAARAEAASSSSSSSSSGVPPSPRAASAPRKRRPSNLKAASGAVRPAAISEALAYAFDEYQEPSDEGEESADDAAQSELAPSRKRVAKPGTWKRNNRPKKVKVLEKPPCGCGLRCFVTFGRTKRKRIREAFATLPRAEQKAYMKELIDLKRPASKGPALQICHKQPRLFTATYHLKEGQLRRRVCFKAFIAVLGVGAFQVKALNKKCGPRPTRLWRATGAANMANSSRRLSQPFVASSATSRPFRGSKATTRWAPRIRSVWQRT